MTPQLKSQLHNCAATASCIAVRIYNTIRRVGNGEITADNALHLMVEDYKNARELANELNAIALNTQEAK